MGHVVAIFGTLIALNLGFGFWLSEENAAAVDIAGEWFFDANVGDDAQLVFYNEDLGGVTTLTIIGLDAGALAISSNDLQFTA